MSGAHPIEEQQPAAAVASVLVVEDDAGSRAALAEVLGGGGYRLITVSSGEEALRRLLESDFAVILLDVQLPGIDGFETAKLIRSRRRSYHTPIIFLTGVHPEWSHVFRGYEVGAVDYMVKPIVPEILKSKVAVFVDLYEKNAQIKAQKERLRALAQRSQRRFYDLVQGLDAVVWEGQLNHQFTFVSQRAEPMLGYPLDAWFADRYFRARLIHPGDREEALAAYRRAAAERRSAVIEYRVVRADGRPLWMRDHVHVVCDPHDQPIQLRGVMVDITANKETEARLEAQAAQLQSADRHRNEFLAMLGHELRNPLAPIQSAVEWLRLQARESGKDGNWGVEIIGKQVNYMKRLVDDLLDVGRITSGKIELQRQACDLNEIAAQALETVAPQIEAKRHRLIHEPAASAVPVNGDPVRLAQVIANLLHNAVKYTEEGGELRLRLAVEEERGVVRVTDNGVGIAPEMHERVFDLFTQSESDRELARGGLGVGLTLVRTLVHMHGGEVEVCSEGLGRGSEFTVYLPLDAARVQAAPPPETASAGEAEVCRRILVVDDNADAATSLAALLEALGHEVRTVGDGPAALAATPGFKPAAVFLDIGLPGMNGFEVARQLRAAAGTPPRLIALTGFGSRAEPDAPSGSEFDHFLLKPTTLHSITEALAGL